MKIDFSEVHWKKSRKALATEYLSVKEANSHCAPLGKSTFMRIIARVTSIQSHAKHCVDYFIGVMLFKTMRSFEYILGERGPGVL